MLGFLFFLFSVVLGLVIAAAIMGVATYNRLGDKAQVVMERHANIMVSMQKRVNLVNKLQDIASSYSDHEKLTHVSVVDRNKADAREVSRSSKEADHTLSAVNTVARNSPELRANETYQQLMRQLDDIERNLQNNREDYNGAVRAYNSDRSSIPTVFIASTLGFEKAPYFDVENAESLENLDDFVSEDAEDLKKLLGNAGQQLAETSRKVGAKASEHGRNLADHAREYAQDGRAETPPKSAPGDPSRDFSTEPEASASPSADASARASAGASTTRRGENGTPAGTAPAEDHASEPAASSKPPSTAGS